MIPRRQEVIGRLVDYSTQRLSRRPRLRRAAQPAKWSSFEHAVAGGQARVMWNRIADDRVETGFLVLKIAWS